MLKIITGDEKWVYSYDPQSVRLRRADRSGVPLPHLSSFSSTFAELRAVNSSFRVKLSMLSSSAPLWGVWARTFRTNTLNYGAMKLHHDNVPVQSIYFFGCTGAIDLLDLAPSDPPLWNARWRVAVLTLWSRSSVSSRWCLTPLKNTSSRERCVAAQGDDSEGDGACYRCSLWTFNLTSCVEW